MCKSPVKTPNKHQLFSNRSHMMPHQEKTQVKNDKEMP